MKRWPIIRHVRWLYHYWILWRWWKFFGRHFWLTPNLRDLEHLDQIWRGDA